MSSLSSSVYKLFSHGISVTGHKDIFGKPALVCILDLFAASSLVGINSARIVWERTGPQVVLRIVKKHTNMGMFCRDKRLSLCKKN